MLEEKPFAEIPYSEYRLRNERVRELMERYKIDGLILFCRENHVYYAGWRETWDHNFLVAVVLSREGETVLVGPGHIHFGVLSYTYVDRIKRWEELNPKNDPVRSVIEVLEELRLKDKRLGLELGVGMYPWKATPSEMARLKENLPKASFVDASEMIWEQRMVKTQWEIDLYRKLGKILAEGFRRGLRTVREGVTERDVQKVMWNYYISQGLEDTIMQGGIIVRSHPFGVYTPAYTGRAVDRKLARGDQLMLDGGPTLKGYHTDIQRQAVIGEPSALQKKLHKLAMVGYEAGIEIIKPGTKGKDLWRVPLEAQRKEDPTYSPSWRFTGHCIGLRIHEPPSWMAEEERELVPGMVLTLEVAGYDIPQWRVLGAFPEDMFLVTENGHEVLSDGLSRELWVG